ncbi:unnamed protein product [Ambrosiozyma monospora]|uniref:Exocyst complex component SEC5 n=1 Tax=Ambrosiozyma monospora TaxID=43982 RepID=A0A9W6T681_AMBMO|nr:unnamed protein product [Ambrosiozyma monospora]
MGSRTEFPSTETLADFYQLKTLQPTNYTQDSIIDSNFENLDLSTVTPETMPKELIFNFLGDNSNDQSHSDTDPKTINYSDPLGYHRSVLDELINKNIIKDSNDPKRSKFTIDSKSFNVKLFLSTVHKDKTSSQLLKAVQYLDRDIDSKKSELQSLIGNNFSQTLKS